MARTERRDGEFCSKSANPRPWRVRNGEKEKRREPREREERERARERREKERAAPCDSLQMQTDPPCNFIL